MVTEIDLIRCKETFYNNHIDYCLFTRSDLLHAQQLISSLFEDCLPTRIPHHVRGSEQRFHAMEWEGIQNLSFIGIHWDWNSSKMHSLQQLMERLKLTVDS